ncbi:MAG: 3-oxoacyl-ACP reductase FabG [Alphaproteobacteria bacterium]|nr:3-oxoacyl-ACP reductase FabG [Alphaproteobacteria bacterium]
MKRALVTGGSSPIGAAVADELAAAGMHVIVHANRNIAAAQETVDRIVAAGGSAEALALDLLDPSSAERLATLAETAPIQVLTHCVGGQRDMPFAAMSPEDWSQIIDLNLNSFFATLRPIIVPMMRGRWGRIIAVSSLTAVTGNRGQTNYAAAKGGMLALMKSLAREYGSRGITANVVAPGLIDTPETKALANYRELTLLSPSQRAGTPDEVAALVGFLASEKAGYISGQLICVDGGTA